MESNDNVIVNCVSLFQYSFMLSDRLSLRLSFGTSSMIICRLDIVVCIASFSTQSSVQCDAERLVPPQALGH